MATKRVHTLSPLEQAFAAQYRVGETCNGTRYTTGTFGTKHIVLDTLLHRQHSAHETAAQASHVASVMNGKG